jgi:hypothetical protein
MPATTTSPQPNKIVTHSDNASLIIGGSPVLSDAGLKSEPRSSCAVDHAVAPSPMNRGPHQNSLRIAVWTIVAILVTGVCAAFIHDADFQRRNRAATEKAESERREFRFEMQRRKNFRETIMERRRQAIEDLNFDLLDKIDAEWKEKEAEWKEDDFRKELLGTIKER